MGSRGGGGGMYIVHHSWALMLNDSMDNVHCSFDSSTFTASKREKGGDLVRTLVLHLIATWLWKLHVSKNKQTAYQKAGVDRESGTLN